MAECHNSSSLVIIHEFSFGPCLSPHIYCCCLPCGTSSSLSCCHWPVGSASHWLRLKCAAALESPVKHSWTCACSNRAELCLNTHSAAASSGEMFNCSLTRRANYMTATQVRFGIMEDVLEHKKVIYCFTVGA